MASRIHESFDGLSFEQSDYPDELATTSRSEKAYLGAGEWTVTTWNPDGTREIGTYSGGMLVQTRNTDSGGNQLYTVTPTYDGLNRQETSTDSRNGITTLGYVDALLDLVESTQDPDGNLTAVTYDARNRSTLVDAPDTQDQSGGSLSNDTATAYFTDGKVKDISGGQAYHRTYTYDYAGRLKTLTTYGTATAVTRWIYDPARGWLTGKRYNSPTEGSGAGPGYAYTAAGRLKTQTQVRLVAGNPLVTTYHYGTADNSSPELLDGVSHSDGTPGYSVVSRDLFGRPEEIADAAAGTRNISYYDYGPESISSVTGTGLHSGTTALNEYDDLGRLAAIGHLHAASGFSQSVAYGHDGAGRLAKVVAHGVTASYRFDPVNQQVSQLGFSERRGSGAFGGDSGADTAPSRPVLQNTRRYDSLGRLKGTTWHSASTGQASKPLAHWGYGYNGLGQRTAASDLAGDSWLYGYNAAGEVTKADKKKAGSTDLYPGRQFRYAYDGIGNRTAAESGGDSSGSGRRSIGYTPNALNQYGTITHPGSFDVTARAPLAASPTVDGQPADELGTYFRKELSVSNATGPVWKEVEVSDGTQTVAGFHFVPKASVGPIYDEDGNLKDDGRWTYTWDASNRLVGIVRSSLAPGTPYLRVEYTYDYLDRRIGERRFNSLSSSTPDAATIWLYEGWNCIAELDGSWDLRREYVWGRDLSGSLQGAGGTGGLLWMRDGPSDKLHFCAFDGNGNVTNLIGEDGAFLTASYEYSPFGEVMKITGNYAAINPVGFSTRFHDKETGLCYYGYRYLDPAAGRWLSKDPMHELAGPNLYALIGNDSVGEVDMWGLLQAPQMPDLQTIMDGAKVVVPAGGALVTGAASAPGAVLALGAVTVGAGVATAFEVEAAVDAASQLEQIKRQSEELRRRLNSGDLIYRAMLEDSAYRIHPATGNTADHLGVRPPWEGPPPRPNGYDVITKGGMVHPLGADGKFQGMSTAPSLVALMVNIPFRVPLEYFPEGHSGKSRKGKPVSIYAMSRRLIPPTLYASYDNSAHVTVAPAFCMDYNSYQRTLWATKFLWFRITPEKGEAPASESW
ncbi:RHS repeat-associated core domain-containing protein [Luteolibacter sp. Populi]|uniref:RHS repeat-associated core domain-containing protein n=1 Tax=Luteolibacter sp. Populi TaxID=3230487 RepID=UPI003465BDCB